MANGRFYNDGSGAMSYSPDRSRDVDYNRHTKPFPASDLFG